MKFIVSAGQLKSAMEKVSKALPKTTTIPELSNFLFTVKEKALVISATNMRNTSSQEVELRSDGEVGQILVQPSLMKLLPKNMVELVTIGWNGDHKIVAKFADNTTARIQGRIVEDYPETVDTTNLEKIEYAFLLGKASEKKMLMEDLKHSAHCAAKTERSIQGMSGLYLVPNHNSDLEAMSVDGNRMALVIIRGSYQGQDKRNPFPLPTEGLAILMDWIKRTNETAILSFYEGEGTYRKLIEMKTQTSRLLLLVGQDEMLDYLEYIPEGKDRTENEKIRASIDRKKFKAVLDKYNKVFDMKRLQLIFKENGNHYIQYLEEGGPEVEIPFDHVGAVEEPVDCVDGDIGFNSQYLQEAMASMSGDKIKFFIGGQGMPGYFYSDDENQRTIIMSLFKP